MNQLTNDVDIIKLSIKLNAIVSDMNTPKKILDAKLLALQIANKISSASKLIHYGQ